MLIFEEEAAETYCDKRVPGCNTPILNVKGLEPTLIPPHIKDKVYFLVYNYFAMNYRIIEYVVKGNFDRSF